MDYGVGTLIGGGLNVFGTWLNNEYAKEREKIAREENYRYNEMAANAADARTRALYSDFYSPQAQLKQIKDAGLSPSLYYSGGVAGSSGQSGAQGSGASGIAPNIYGVNLLEGAQLDKLRAETRLINEQAKTEKGTNEKGKLTLEQLAKQIGLADVQTNAVKLTNAMQEIQNKIANATTDEQIKTIVQNSNYAEHQATYMFNEAMHRGLEWQFDKDTFDARKENVIKDNALKTAQAMLAESQRKLNEEEKAKLIAECEEIYNRLYYYTDVDVASSKAYSNWLNTQANNLPQQFELLEKRYQLEKTKMWVDLAKDIFKVGAQTTGMIMFGKGAKGKAPITTPQVGTQNPELIYYL